jgi:Flp pilus assembly protein TadG
MIGKGQVSRRRAGEQGSELVEFALVFPLLLLVVLAIVDFGFLFQRYEVLTNAAREGARVAVLPGYTTADIQARVTSYASAGGLPTTPTIAITPTTITAGTSTWPATTVNVSFSHQYLFLGPMTAWFGGSLSAVTLTAASTMRNE